ncbi:hypothetical protein TSOC_006894 [Tetrabaena socialis]|uniref:C-type lectin domain-containing protein n=1 Tax=Tetrabaena socialis TaxID=47790 RepID=A0A2J8A2D3_9CHLO|nr:hypothetical protein TSOC_006894 [Tetrabaena socialis]|eukprot:PNH06680.1 hypothetical protein TSOC_006894 [Tetrabaena socialis]
MRPPSPGLPFWLADLACVGINGRLVTLNTISENNAVIDFINNVTRTNSTFTPTDLDIFGNLRVWIGLRFDSSADNSWWTDGTRVDQGFQYGNALNPGLPNSCYAIWTRSDFWVWQPQPCYQNLPAFMCEVAGWDGRTR